MFCAPVGGKQAKENMVRIIENFGRDDFDYFFFVYDDTSYGDEIFKPCKIIHEKGMKWKFAKKYLYPEFCEGYDYIFIWDDDINVDGFSCKRFMGIVKKNNLQMAQPALTKDSYFSLAITRKDPKSKIGRYTDFVEIMVPVFTREAWKYFWENIEDDYNHWGWGYDELAKSLCGYSNMGIVDEQPVKHSRPVQSSFTIASDERKIFLRSHKKKLLARKISYAALK